MSAAARRLRAVPHAPQIERGFDNSLHARYAELLGEKGSWAGKMQRLIRDHHEAIAERDREYEALADRYNDQRAELAAWRAWMAQWSSYPALRGKEERR